MPPVLTSAIKLIGHLYRLLFSVLVSVGLALAVYALWDLYQEAKLTNQFLKEAQVRQVRVEKTSFEPRIWRDYLGNTAYLSFLYKGKPYTTRFVMDTLYVGEGDQIALLYHPGLDAFLQPSHQFRYTERAGVSKLIRWSVVSTFSQENRLLVACLGVTAFFLLYTTGVVAKIAGLSVKGPAQAVGGILLVAGSLLLSYDAWGYYRYYRQLKTQGQLVTVQVLNTDRISHSRRGGRRRRVESWKWYTYMARVQFNQQVRTIPIAETEYEHLKPGDRLSALYEARLDDLMSTAYSIEYPYFIAAGFLWLISFLIIGGSLRPARQTPQPGLH